MIRKASIATVVEILERLERKVDEHIIEDRSVFKDIRESLDGCDEYPGVRGRLDRLEKRLTDSDIDGLKMFRLQVKTLGTMLVGIIGFLGWDWLRNFFTITVIQNGK
jgi:hypothetical protein